MVPWCDESARSAIEGITFTELANRSSVMGKCQGIDLMAKLPPRNNKATRRVSVEELYLSTSIWHQWVDAGKLCHMQRTTNICQRHMQTALLWRPTTEAEAKKARLTACYGIADFLHSTAFLPLLRTPTIVKNDGLCACRKDADTMLQQPEWWCTHMPTLLCLGSTGLLYTLSPPEGNVRSHPSY